MKQVPQIITLDPLPVVGMRVHMSMMHNKNAELWPAFRQRCGEIPHRVPDHHYAIQHYAPEFPAGFTPATEFEQWAVVPVSATGMVPEGMLAGTLDGGQYAVFVHRGPARTFAQTANYIYQTWLPSSGYVIDQRTHFQHMGPDYRGPLDPDSEELVYVPIRVR